MYFNRIFDENTGIDCSPLWGVANRTTLPPLSGVPMGLDKEGAVSGFETYHFDIGL